MILSWNTLTAGCGNGLVVKHVDGGLLNRLVVKHVDGGVWELFGRGTH